MFHMIYSFKGIVPAECCNINLIRCYVRTHFIIYERYLLVILLNLFS